MKPITTLLTILLLPSMVLAEVKKQNQHPVRPGGGNDGDNGKERFRHQRWDGKTRDGDLCMTCS